ncbi:homoserine kinase [Paenibacillus rhizosphaerae]|uniref:Homoserine kinase n=1 Tax=Paenibacillus rhizosphaerae TaxID=297318 RepID=A0A839U2E8_9BACL|nr:homoserine kinase [Paenibacillus rhizosphaerae]MBB3131838.1 homoserine kinase [Paenibacillus rhizosphaerae]
MIQPDGVRVKIPASTANLGPGFDTLGMALSLYAWIEMKEAEQTVFHLYGDEMQGIPRDKSNLLYQVAQQVFERAGVHVPELEISMYSDIPLTRGLGSSATAIVGALAAANALIGSPLSKADLFDMATGIEDHPDNVGASLYGGIITAIWDGVHAECIRFDPPEDLEVLVVVPDFELQTSEARKVLPDHISRKDAVYNVSRASFLVGALAGGRMDLIGKAMLDRLHQPYRAPLIPGMTRILEEAGNHGALGVALSGAGPTLLALVDRQQSRKNELEAFLLNTMRAEGINASAKWLLPDVEGVVEISGMPSRSFMDMVKGK